MFQELRPSVLAGAGSFAMIAFSLAAPIHADVINIQSDSSASTEGLGSFVGSLNYEFNGSENYWELTVTLENTSPAANGGKITGFIFNIDSSDGGANASLVFGSHPFKNAPDQDGQPFGTPYNSGAALGGYWLGGGSPEGGIEVGDTGLFKFSVTASDAAFLTASAFINGPYKHDFVVRFRGFNDEGSDKVPAAVPGPAVLTILALGLMLPFRGRRRD